MLLDELIPACAHRFKLGGGGRKRAIIGWSMGAYGALVAGETDPVSSPQWSPSALPSGPATRR